MFYAPVTTTRLRRPRLLIVAMRHLLAEATLNQILKACPPEARNLDCEGLAAFEQSVEAARQAGDFNYNAAQHIAVLALLRHRWQSCTPFAC